MKSTSRKEGLVYDKDHRNLIGFANLGKINDIFYSSRMPYMGKICNNNLEVLIIRDLFHKLNFPYARFAVSNCDNLLMNSVWEVAFTLKRMGFHVLALMCDGASIDC